MIVKLGINTFVTETHLHSLPYCKTLPIFLLNLPDQVFSEISKEVFARRDIVGIERVTNLIRETLREGLARQT